MVFHNDCFPRIMSNARPYPALRNPTPNIAVIAWGWIGFSVFFFENKTKNETDKQKINSVIVQFKEE